MRTTSARDTTRLEAARTALAVAPLERRSGNDARRKLGGNVAPARLENDGERQGEKNEQNHEGDGDAETAALRLLNRRSHRKRRHPGDAPTRCVPSEDVIHGNRHGTRVRLQETAYEDLAGQ